MKFSKNEIVEFTKNGLFLAASIVMMVYILMGFKLPVAIDRFVQTWIGKLTILFAFLGIFARGNVALIVLAAIIAMNLLNMGIFARSNVALIVLAAIIAMKLLNMCSDCHYTSRATWIKKLYEQETAIN